MSHASGTVYVRGTSSSAPATVTVAPGITVHGKGVMRGYYSGDNLVNQGLIVGDASDGTLTISSLLTNTGTLARSGSGILATLMPPC